MSEKVLQQFSERAATALVALRALVNEKCEHDDKFSLGKTIFIKSKFKGTNIIFQEFSIRILALFITQGSSLEQLLIL